MKKSLILLLLSFALISCSSGQAAPSTDKLASSQTAVETDKTRRYEFDLTMDNYWKFIDVRDTSTTGNYETLSFTFSGVLSYAYYEDVRFTVDYKAHGAGGIYSPSGDYEAKIVKELNAGGNGVLNLPYDYIPEETTPAFSGASFYGYERTISILGVSGKVLFAI